MLLFGSIEPVPSTGIPMPKPLQDLTDQELRAAWEDGNWLATQGGITPEQERLLERIERELARRHRP
jgi:hypothetical protein